jgi:hypothetical protein
MVWPTHHEEKKKKKTIMKKKEKRTIMKKKEKRTIMTKRKSLQIRLWIDICTMIDDNTVTGWVVPCVQLNTSDSLAKHTHIRLDGRFTSQLMPKKISGQSNMANQCEHLSHDQQVTNVLCEELQ